MRSRLEASVNGPLVGKLALLGGFDKVSVEATLADTAIPEPPSPMFRVTPSPAYPRVIDSPMFSGTPAHPRVFDSPMFSGTGAPILGGTPMFSGTGTPILVGTPILGGTPIQVDAGMYVAGIYAAGMAAGAAGASGAGTGSDKISPNTKNNLSTLAAAIPNLATKAEQTRTTVALEKGFAEQGRVASSIKDDVNNGFATTQAKQDEQIELAKSSKKLLIANLKQGAETGRNVTAMVELAIREAEMEEGLFQEEEGASTQTLAALCSRRPLNTNSSAPVVRVLSSSSLDRRLLSARRLPPTPTRRVASTPSRHGATCAHRQCEPSEPLLYLFHPFYLSRS